MQDSSCALLTASSLYISVSKSFKVVFVNCASVVNFNSQKKARLLHFDI